VTTATRRLRRASIAGLATVATAVAVVGSAGSAFAFGGTTGGAGLGGSVTETNVGTIFPGVASQALDDITLVLSNSSTAGGGTAGGGWAAGDFIKFTVVSATNAELSRPDLNANRTAVLAGTPTVTAVDSVGSAAVTGATIALANGAAGTNDAFVLQLPTAPADTGTTTFDITGLKLTLGTNQTATTAGFQAVASNGAPFGTGAGAAIGTANVVAAAIGTVSVSAGAPVGVSATVASTITAPAITAKDVTGGQFATSVVFTLGGSDTWSTVGSLSAPSGVVLGAGTIAGAVLTYPIASGTVPAGGTFVLTNAAVNAGATAGVHNVTVSSNGHSGVVEIAFAGVATREGGADRYATAAQLFNTAFGAGTGSHATTAVVASGVNYPDALSATYLAASNATGVLLTDPNVLPSSTQQVLTNGYITTVYIVGGTAAVSQNVQNAIAALHVGNTTVTLSVIRISGADRYATNGSVDLNGGVSASTGTTAIIATGENYADALAAAPAIAKSKYPLILTPTASLGAAALSTINALGIKNVIILGGTSAVSTAVETSLTTDGVTILQRLAGADRTLTAQQIATWETQGITTAGAYSVLPSLGFVWGTAAGDKTAEVVNIARGDNYPDALGAGAVLAVTGTGTTTPAQHGQVLLLTASSTVLGAGIPAYLSGLGTSGHATTVNAIGLASAVSGSTLAAALGSIS
jgi:putative cell wall-binding protein